MLILYGKHYPSWEALLEAKHRELNINLKVVVFFPFCRNHKPSHTINVLYFFLNYNSSTSISLSLVF